MTYQEDPFIKWVGRFVMAVTIAAPIVFVVCVIVFVNALSHVTATSVASDLGHAVGAFDKARKQ